MKGKLIDLTGKRFGRLCVLTRAENGKYKGAWWHVRCGCGNGKIVHGALLRRGDARSCGCLTRDRMTTHGMSNTPEHKAWSQARSRCNNPNTVGWRNYGARGIRMCKEWDDFMAFYKDVGPWPGPGYSLDRIDVNGNYESGNVRWSTPKEQAKNRRAPIRLADFEQRVNTEVQRRLAELVAA